MTKSSTPEADDRDLQPGERELKGAWLDLGSHLVRDDVCARIEWLIAERLELVEEREAGRWRFYRDPRDGRLWEWKALPPHTSRAGPMTLTLVEGEKGSGMGEPKASTQKKGNKK